MASRTGMVVIVKTLVGKTRKLVMRPRKNKLTELTIFDGDERPIATVRIDSNRKRKA